MDQNQIIDDIIKTTNHKIKTYKIKTTLNEVLDNMSGILQESEYSETDKLTELNFNKEIIDTGIEKFLCRKSCLYFLTHYWTIEIKGIGFLPFRPYYFQENVILDDFMNEKTIMFLKTRQVGISTTSGAYAAWRAMFFDSENIAIISRNEPDARQIFYSPIKENLTKMSSYLIPPNFNKKKDCSKGEIRFIDNKSQIQIKSCSSSAARGLTPTLILLDEFAFYDERQKGLSELLWTSITGAMAKVREVKHAAGLQNGQIVIISTPNGSEVGKQYYRMWYDTENQIKKVEIDWFEVPEVSKGNIDILKEFIKQDYYHKPKVREEMKIYFNSYLRDILDNPQKYPKHWLIAQRASGEIPFRQEILHDFIISGDSVFSAESIETLEKKVTEPIEKYKNKKLFPVNEWDIDEIKGLWYWELPIANEKYLITVDASSGTGDDFACIHVMKPSELKQVAEFYGKLIPKKLADILTGLAKYYNNAFVIIETEKHGKTCFDHVYKSPNNYKNVFKTEKKDEYGNVSYEGWQPSSGRRMMMVENLINWIENPDSLNQLQIYSRRLINELRTLEMRNNKIQAGGSTHDDAVMTLMLALFNLNKVKTHRNYNVSITGESNGIVGTDNSKFIGASKKILMDTTEVNYKIKREIYESVEQRTGLPYSEYVSLIPVNEQYIRDRLNRKKGIKGENIDLYKQLTKEDTEKKDLDNLEFYKNEFNLKRSKFNSDVDFFMELSNLRDKKKKEKQDRGKNAFNTRFNKLTDED